LIVIPSKAKPHRGIRALWGYGSFDAPLRGLLRMTRTRVLRMTGATSLGAAGGRRSPGAVCAAVDKIEEKRKPEDFIGHRKREGVTLECAG